MAASGKGNQAGFPGRGSLLYYFQPRGGVTNNSNNGAGTSTASTSTSTSMGTTASTSTSTGTGTSTIASSSTRTRTSTSTSTSIRTTASRAAVRESLKTIAQTTLSAIESGSFTHGLHRYRIPAVSETHLYTPGDLSTWDTHPPRSLLPSPAQQTQISILNLSTLEAAALLWQTRSQTRSQTRTNINGADVSPQRNQNQNVSPPPPPPQMTRVGILNFASATKPGGGFINGAQAQEESIARASNLYPSLTCSVGQPFYDTHKADIRKGYYTHTMIWSGGTSVFRDDRGGWHAPFQVDVVTSAAVNAGVILRWAIDASYEEARIETVMRERMSRILFVFEKHGVARVVLGSFGTGVFQNKVELVARLWAELLARRGARFERSFEQVVFAVIDEKTCEQFREVFERWSDFATGAGAGAGAGAGEDRAQAVPREDPDAM